MEPEELAEMKLDLAMALDTCEGIVAMLRAEGMTADLAEFAEQFVALATATAP